RKRVIALCARTTLGRSSTLRWKRYSYARAPHVLGWRIENRASRTAMANFNDQAKRKRELAKQDKRAAKDRKRAQRKAAARGQQAPAAIGAAAPSPVKSAPSLPKA